MKLLLTISLTCAIVRDFIALARLGRVSQDRGEYYRLACTWLWLNTHQKRRAWSKIAMSYLISRIYWVHALSRRLSVNLRAVYGRTKEGVQRREALELKPFSSTSPSDESRQTDRIGLRSQRQPLTNRRSAVYLCVIRRGLTSTLGEHVLAILPLNGRSFISSSLPSPRQSSHTVFADLSRSSSSLPRPECQDD